MLNYFVYKESALCCSVYMATEDEEKEFPTVSLETDDSWKPEHLKKIRLLFPDSDRAIIVRGVLTPVECKRVIASIEKAGLTSLQKERGDERYSSRNRVCNRTIMNDSAFSSLLETRLKDYILPSLSISVNSSENDKTLPIKRNMAGDWHLDSVNPRWRGCRYDPGGFFAPHYDDGFSDGTRKTFVTIMTYLNTIKDGQGGRTCFWIDKNYENVRDNTLGEPDECFCPQAGDVLLFYQHIMHKGERLDHGVKYMIRSDVLYKCIRPDVVPEKVAAAKKLVDEGNMLEAEGKIEAAIRCYSKAEVIDPDVWK